MNKSKALELLKQCLSDSPRTEEEYNLWCDKARDVIKAAFTEDSDEYQRFSDTFFGLVEGWENMLPRQKIAVKSILQKHDILGTPSTSDTVVVTAPYMETTVQAPKAFIAHGGETPALIKLKEFLDALGLFPMIVEEQPSEGRSINEQVNWCLDQCDCAIVLATKGDIDGNTGEFIPRGNVLNEIGRFQERFSSKVVYLIECCTKFPTNISEKVWELFDAQSMDKAFIKVARELAAFGIIKAVKPT